MELGLGPPECKRNVSGKIAAGTAASSPAIFDSPQVASRQGGPHSSLCSVQTMRALGIPRQPRKRITHGIMWASCAVPQLRK